MNIAQAKEQIKNTVIAYLSRDEYGNSEISREEQRPVFLIGAPGIGKTAIMKQISSELGINLVSYSMTHHTRQSALGLPYITEKIYDGQEYRVSEYTMSEIIASVYNTAEKTGIKEGILFLDEINCVSETLAPSMLQFLQFKTFGGHSVPDGWIVVTAGNPPEYNRSVRPFDIVTMDRLKRIDVAPDYGAFRKFSLENNIHPAVLTYLEIKKQNFYAVEMTAEGRIFVTARGWTDLSSILRLYEKKGLTVNSDLISQYIQHPKIARDFSAYYDLFRKYRADYEIESILAGSPSEAIHERALKAAFDERIALCGLLLDRVCEDAQRLCVKESALLEIRNHIKQEDSSEKVLDEIEKKLEKAAVSHSMKEEQLRTLRFEKHFYENATGDLRDAFRSESAAFKDETVILKQAMENVFEFLEAVFRDSHEMLIFVTELTTNRYSSLFISHYGCEGYFRHSHDLMFYERNKEIAARIAEMEGLD